MNFELGMILAITRRLPKVKGSGLLGNLLKKLYNRKPRSAEKSQVLGFNMLLDPNECVDGELLFYPELYDRMELEYIRSNLAKGECFIDAGANIGLYSLVASGVVGDSGQIIAIEADLYNADKLRMNLKLNSIDNITVVQKGLSDKQEELVMNINMDGNRGGNTLVALDGIKQKGVSVDCDTLYSILIKLGIKKIGGMKMDIEGFEYRVLKTFYNNAPKEYYPRFLIIEINSGYAQQGSSDLHELITNTGYKFLMKTELNSIYSL
jgi:FkbM family methyltransferase